MFQFANIIRDTAIEKYLRPTSSFNSVASTTFAPNDIPIDNTERGDNATQRRTAFYCVFCHILFSPPESLSHAESMIRETGRLIKLRRMVELQGSGLVVRITSQEQAVFDDSK